MTNPTQPLNADPAKDSDELFREKARAQIMRNLEEIEKMAAERATMASQREKMAATAKMQTENQWYPTYCGLDSDAGHCRRDQIVFIMLAIQMRKG